jgi:hypothetical protein
VTHSKKCWDAYCDQRPKSDYNKRGWNRRLLLSTSIEWSQ